MPRRFNSKREWIESLDRNPQRWRICGHPLHDKRDPFVPPEGWINSRTYRYCRKCTALEAANRKARRMAKRTDDKKRKILNSLKKGHRAPDLPEATVKGLKIWGGLDGFFACVKAEFEAAKEGSTTRKELLSMMFRLLTTNALSGGSENVDQFSNEELDEAWEEEFGALEKEEDEDDDEDMLDDDLIDDA